MALNLPHTTEGLIIRARAQELSDELEPNEIAAANFEVAYDEMVLLVRALADRLETVTE